MKKSIILLVMVLMSALTKAYSEPITMNCNSETLAVKWTGSYTTSFGDIILHQKGKHVVGTYRELGAIRSTYVAGNALFGIFYNGGREGKFRFEKTANGFTGTYAWAGQETAGQWNGTKKTDLKQHYLKGNWKTNFQNIYFIHSPTGIVAGHYGNNGGMIWGKYVSGMNKLTGNYNTKVGAKVEDFSMNFINNNEFKGRYGNTQTGSWNGTRVLNTSSATQASSSQSSSSSGSTKAFLLKNTLNSIKFNRSNDVGNGDMQEVNISSNIQINNRAVPSRDNSNKSTSFLYKGSKRKWTVGEVMKPQNAIVFHIAQSINEINHNASFSNSLSGNDFGKVRIGVGAFGVPMFEKRDINLKEILKFLSGETLATDYPVASGQSGRRRLPNTDDTFWLETVGGKRYARGYGDILLDNGDLRYGYHYTLELVTE